MTRQVRSWAIAALAAFAVAGAAAPSFAGITYNVTNYELGQNGWSVNGTITVSGVGSYTNSSAIEAWDITLSKDLVTHRLRNSTSSATNPKGLIGTLNATSTSLSLLNNSLLDFQESDNNSFIRYYNNWGIGFLILNNYTAMWESESLWESNGAFSPVVGNAWTIGTATPSAVPEIDPATGGSALSLVAGVLSMIEQRRRRATLVA
jgi:hypothetical protein